MSEFNWNNFLTQESRKVVEWYKEQEKVDSSNWHWGPPKLPSEFIESEWLGFPGASEEQIAKAEARLGVKLPPSYRQFLKITNGWYDYRQILKAMGKLEDSTAFQLWSVEKIEWLYTVENQEWINGWWITPDQDIPSVPDEKYFVYGEDAWPQPLRTEYLQTALQISDDKISGEGDVVLLNPQVVHNDEWEAWIFIPEMGGAKRYRSFREMLQTVGMADFSTLGTRL